MHFISSDELWLIYWFSKQFATYLFSHFQDNIQPISCEIGLSFQWKVLCRQNFKFSQPIYKEMCLSGKWELIRGISIILVSSVSLWTQNLSNLVIWRMRVVPRRTIGSIRDWFFNSSHHQSHVSTLMMTFPKLSKHQPLLPTTVLLRTSLTWMISWTTQLIITSGMKLFTAKASSIMKCLI